MKMNRVFPFVILAFVLGGCSGADQTLAPASATPMQSHLSTSGRAQGDAFNGKSTMRTAKAGYVITAASFPDYLTAGLIAGVDAHGDMAGFGSETDDYAPNCVYANGQTTLDLSGIQSGTCAFTGMNAAGTAVGQFYDASDSLNYGAVYAQADFSTLDSPVNGFLGVNDKGLAIANIPSGGLSVYSLAKGKVLYDLYDSGQKCAMYAAYDINNRGVVFGYDECQGGATRYETVSNHGVFDFLQLPSGYAVSRGPGNPVFNDAGTIALNKTSGGHAYLWSTITQGTPTDLGALPEDPSGTYYVTGLNGTTAVGITSDKYSWVWTVKNGMQNLATLVGANSYGWIQPEAIDARGDLGCVSSVNPSVWLYLKR